MIESIRKNKKLVIIIWLFMLLGFVILVMFNNKSSLKVIKQVELTSGRRSYENKEEGAWNLTKTAKWIEFRKARIEFNFDSIAKKNIDFNSITTAREAYGNQDILLVIDTSSGMNGKKLESVKSAIKKLIENKFSKSNDNRIGIISFNTDSEIILNLTNNKDELISKIDSLTASGSVNYYKALVNVESILKNYEPEYVDGFIVLFITSGYPNQDTPLEVGEYSIIKDKYSYTKIKGIQYEMGDYILEPITKVSDNQYVADMSNLENVLIDASNNSDYFEKVEITDYIHDDFRVDSVDDIIPSVGTVKLEDDNGRQKVIWTIPSDTLKTGMSANLTIDVILQEESYDKEYVITNEKEEITVKLSDEESETQKTTIRPTLKNASKVIYHGNSPSDCTLSGVPGKKYYAPLEPVTIEEKATCSGYVFKNWNIDNENVSMINKNTFIMPDEDVSLTAKWGKFNLSKSMEGEVAPKLTGAEYLINNSNSTEITNYEDGDSGEMYTFTHTVNGNIVSESRYIGEGPNNYVYFNCMDDDIDTCEIWRIIGTFDVERTDPEDSSKTITETRIKIVRGNLLAKTSAWNSNSVNDWSDASLQTYLNGDYYNSLSQTAQSQIENAIYYLGGRTLDATTHYGSAEDMYVWERGTTVYSGRPTEWEGKVALMYPSDLYMVYVNGSGSRCYNDPYYGYCYMSDAARGWIFNSNTFEGSTSRQITWLLSPYPGSANSAFMVNSYGNMFSDTIGYPRGIRPVVYLKSDIKIATGTGKYDDPYVLE